MLTNLSEIHRIKFNATKHGYSIAKIACLYNAFSEVFEWEASPVEGQTLQPKDKKKEKEERQKNSY